MSLFIVTITLLCHPDRAEQTIYLFLPEQPVFASVLDRR